MDKKKQLKNGLVLTFDVGTQSIRAGLFDKNGVIVSMVQNHYKTPYYSIEESFCEQDGNFHWEQLCIASKLLKEKAGELNWQLIEAVTVTTFRDSVLCLDENYQVLRPLILWLDKRETTQIPKLRWWQFILYNLAGMYGTALQIRKHSACNWLMQYEPEIWDKTKYFVLISAYFNYKLTNKLVDCNANIIGHVPIHFRKKKWHSERHLKYSLFPVPLAKLPPICEPGDIVGTISDKAMQETGIPSGLPLIATGSDKGCETLGLSCLTPDKAALSFGTTATVQITIPKYREPQLFFPSYPSAYKNHFSAEIEIYRGYWLITWFKKEFAMEEVKNASLQGISAEDILNKRLNEIPPGCQGLIFQPYFTPGVETPHAKGSLIGFSDLHTRMHFYRSIIEGINFALIDGLKSMEKRINSRVQTLFLAGGGSKSPEICQITADMFGLPVKRIQTSEAAALGSSMVGFVSLGYYSDLEEAAQYMVKVKDTFYPDYDNYLLYDKLYYHVFAQVFSKLKPLYRNAKQFLKDADNRLRRKQNLTSKKNKKSKKNKNKFKVKKGEKIE